MKYARRRDANENIIVAALEAVGASVQRLDIAGGPDLLVGWCGRNYLLECKQQHGKPGVGMKRTRSGLRVTQDSWFECWKGTRPTVVTNTDEALRAIGARQ